jgi:hypothetical protein
MKVKVDRDLVTVIKDLSNGLNEWSTVGTYTLNSHLKETKELRRLLDILDKLMIQRNKEHLKVVAATEAANKL